MKQLIIFLSIIFLTSCQYHNKISSTNISSAKEKLVIQDRVKDTKTEKVIYLTFDDGPSQYTPQVLKILDDYQVKATFFVTGLNKKYYDYISKAYNKGHAIGLHTFTHDYKGVYQSITAYFKDLNRIQNLVFKQTGKKTDIIRFPGGSSNTISRKYKRGIMKELSQMVRKNGYEYFDWNVSSGDGGSGLSSKKIYKNSTSYQYNSIILLMHDANGKENTVKALPNIIKYYKNKGYSFETLDKNSNGCHHPINN